MSNLQPNAEHSPSHVTLSQSPESLTALAISLQETAQALLALSPASMTTESKKPATKPPARQNSGETRSFYFPPTSVSMERELLQRYHAENFQGLLGEVHTLLVGLVKVMKSVHKDVRVKGYVISSLGAQIDHTSALVLRMRNVYEKVMPVQR